MGDDRVVSDRVLTIPNGLSFVRLLLVPVFAVLVVTKHDGWAITVLVVSGLTDYLDGVLARRWRQVTRIGQLLDPLADRLYILSTLLGLAYRDVVPWWLVAALIARDVAISVALLLLTPEERRPLEVTFMGKAATANLLLAFPILLLGADSGTAGDIARPIGWGFALWGTALYWWSGVIYLRNAAIVRGRRPRLAAAPDEPGRVA